jgi:hypothetical protein
MAPSRKMVKMYFWIILLFPFALLTAEERCEKIFTPQFGIRPIHESESLSGSGSTLENTTEIRKQIPLLLKAFHCNSLLDLPCGDFHWMKTVQLPVETYIGADCIRALIDRHNTLYRDHQRSFIHLDALIQDFPKVDLVLCRDMLVHLSYEGIFKFLKNVKKSGSQYLLTTHFTNLRPNRNIPTGGWRTLNFCQPPFSFPEPLYIILEGCNEEGGIFHDKSLALWKLDDLPNR